MTHIVVYKSTDAKPHWICYVEISKANLSGNPFDHCVQVCFCLTAQSNRVLSFPLSGCVFRGHIHSSRMLCGKHVCGQAADAFVLRLHDVSGTLLKINLSRSFIDELYIGGLNGFLYCVIFQLMFVLGAYLSPTLVEEHTRCSVLAMFIHYFFLCQFSWMFIQVTSNCIYMYIVCI